MTGVSCMQDYMDNIILAHLQNFPKLTLSLMLSSVVCNIDNLGPNQLLSVVDIKVVHVDEKLAYTRQINGREWSLHQNHHNLKKFSHQKPFIQDAILLFQKQSGNCPSD